MQSKSQPACFVLEKNKLKKNLKILRDIEQRAAVKILHTLKSFNEIEGLELINQSLSGFSLSNLEEYKSISTLKSKHIHAYAPIFDAEEILQLAKISKTLSFNSLTQWDNFSKDINKSTSLGLRINPYLNIKQPKYCNPNLPTSRLGVPEKDFLYRYAKDRSFALALKGLHFHVFCYQNINALKYFFHHLSHHYVDILEQLEWINLGGGQTFTSEDYPKELFIETVTSFKQHYPHLNIYFEPGSSVIHNAGYFETTVMDIISHDTTKVLILNTSIESHLLDVAITKQKPKVKGAKNTAPYCYELTGLSCIAGDILGTYCFHKPLKIGDKVIFENMLGYTLVKQNRFNGIKKADFRVEG